MTVKAKMISRRSFLILGAALAGVLAVRGYLASDGAVPDTRTFAGIRFFPGISVRGGGKTWHGDAAFVRDLYDRFAAPREDRYFLTTPRSWFLTEKKLLWRELLVDENKAPSSHAEARDPAWSNYKWNHTDIVADMLQAVPIVNEQAKLSLLVAATATSEPDPVPAWLKAKGLTWTDGEGHVHVRLDKEDGWHYIADLYVAIIQKYGRNWGIANLIMGEYYPGPIDERPPDFDFEAFQANAREIWKDVVANAPMDKNGNRTTIAQVNPILSKYIVPAADLADLKLGIPQSDPYLFVRDCGKPDDALCDAGTLHRVRQRLYGVVPLLHQSDARLFKDGESATWTGIATRSTTLCALAPSAQPALPCGRTGSKGVIPVNSMTIKSHPTLTDDWLSAFDRFGPNGTDAPAWGQLPNRSPTRG